MGGQNWFARGEGNAASSSLIRGPRCSLSIVRRTEPAFPWEAAMGAFETRPLQAAPQSGIPSRHQRPVLGSSLYDLPELAEANEAFTSAVLERLEPFGVSRAGCTRSAAPVWSRLLLGQVGGYRYIKRLS